MKKTITILLFIAAIFFAYFFLIKLRGLETNPESNKSLSQLDVNDVSKTTLGKKVYSQKAPPLHSSETRHTAKL